VVTVVPATMVPLLSASCPGETRSSAGSLPLDVHSPSRSVEAGGVTTGGVVGGSPEGGQ